MPPPRPHHLREPFLAGPRDVAAPPLRLALREGDEVRRHLVRRDRLHASARRQLDRAESRLCGHLAGEFVELRRAHEGERDLRPVVDLLLREFAGVVPVRDAVDADDRQEDGVRDTGPPCGGEESPGCRAEERCGILFAQRSDARRVDHRVGAVERAGESLPGDEIDADGAREHDGVVPSPLDLPCDEPSDGSGSSGDGDPHACILSDRAMRAVIFSTTQRDRM